MSMIYIIKKMYEAFGNYIDISSELRGVNPILKKINISNIYPNDNDVIASLELAASIHKEVRRFLQPYLRPNIKLIDIAKLIETKTIELSNQSKSINKGIGFPVGLAVNECAAHWHPTSKDNRILTKNDIIKIDYGTEVNGWIIDSAFTICFDPKYDVLMEAVKDATYTGIKNINIDVDIGDWGKQIQEIMESYEINLNGKMCPIKAISNLGGHNILKGIIHGGTFLPTVDMKNALPPNYRFKEGVYAVETFGSTGKNVVNEVGESTLYRLNVTQGGNIKMDSTKKLYNKIKNTFKTLPFTDRYLDVFNIPSCKTNLNILCNSKFLHSYPPLCVDNNEYTAQYEHTVYIGENNKIVFSKGEDY
jgi:methionyl aminopeptidase